MFDLTGKKALVTGATGGLGSAIAKALAAQGAIVAISGTREAVLNELAAQIPNSVPLVANLSGEGEAEGLIKRAEEALGGLDILVANAGVTRDGLLMRMKDSDFDDVLKINLYSYFAMCKAEMRGMMKQKSGRIIGIASIVGVTGNAGQANYAASKAGMIGFTKSVAQEVASRGITANCIAPGFIVSPMTEILTDAQKAATMAQIPAGRMGEADEIAALACYLASDEAAYITGQTININGGMAMIQALSHLKGWKLLNISVIGSFHFVLKMTKSFYTFRIQYSKVSLEGIFARISFNQGKRHMSEVLEKVKAIVVEHLNADPEKVVENANFIDDLGADSLDTVELVMAFEEAFGIEIPDDAAEKIQTVGDAVKFISEKQ